MLISLSCDLLHAGMGLTEQPTEEQREGAKGEVQLGAAAGQWVLGA
jgi:hypothetical protein